MSTPKTKAAGVPPAEADLVARDYVYAGRRLAAAGGGLLDALYVIGEDGKLVHTQRCYKAERSSRMIGGIYKGASFSDTQAVFPRSVAWTSKTAA
jgi:hypothetical protein